MAVPSLSTHLGWARLGASLGLGLSGMHLGAGRGEATVEMPSPFLSLFFSSSFSFSVLLPSIPQAAKEGA